MECDKRGPEPDKWAVSAELAVKLSERKQSTNPKKALMTIMIMIKQDPTNRSLCTYDPAYGNTRTGGPASHGTYGSGR